VLHKRFMDITSESKPAHRPVSLRLCAALPN
jgi:hypothetical protein